MPEARAALSACDARVDVLSRSEGIAVHTLVATQLVAEAARRQGGSPTSHAALGRALMGAILLGAAGETLQLQIRGDGPLGALLAIADGDGHARGCASDPCAHPTPKRGVLDIAGAIGRGVLSVVRQPHGGGEPWRGTVPLLTGTIAQDLAHYLRESEQRRAAVGLGVFLSAQGEIEAAGGYLAEALPGASDTEVTQLEANVRHFPGPGELVREGVDAHGIADRLLARLGSGQRRCSHPAFQCSCNRERALRALCVLGRAELDRAVRDAETLELHCRFCGQAYWVPPAELASQLGAA
ncbi:MAG: Hsp33 family molecular chaperone HslO [Myxococcales bacterium]|nr:Hsp33 family molecular chaperone HslO [Myxococcales bacterium]MDH4096600.1 Hsp33 family molecular chaperone HslO [Betaproteobacteria bacterium]MDH5307328.1 Hsp33 family molecular chaperone HslO [Myxococcales bacterium]MDH5566057.1 Hsp33 family molecular chaperone HslO [Myxococcales bacterium]